MKFLVVAAGTQSVRTTAWTSFPNHFTRSDRQGTAPNLTATRKYNPQHGHGEGGAKQVPSRWSALASGGAPQKPAWKNGPNAGGTTGGGSFDRASFRDKTGSVNQQELGEGGRKSLEKSEQPEKVEEKKVVQQQQGKEQSKIF